MSLFDVLVRLKREIEASAKLASVITGVFDEEAPSKQASPYIVIGFAAEYEGRLIADVERRGTVHLHIWSSMKGKSEILKIYKLLDAAITDDTYLFDSFEIVPDNESGWTQGVLGYRFYFDREV